MEFMDKAWRFIQYYALLIWDFCKHYALVVWNFLKTLWHKCRELWRRFRESAFAEACAPVLKKSGEVLVITAKWSYKLRGLLLSIPVFVAAIALAVRNSRLLPEQVGINILTTGEYQWMISRDVAVWVPIWLTLICLLMVIFSKKVLYPWMISLFSLALPLVLWFTNIFPS